MSDEVAALLRDIRDNQREAIAMQREAVATQREHVALYKAQHARWLRMTRFITWFALPMLVVAFAAMLWPWFRYFWWMFTR